MGLVNWSGHGAIVSGGASGLGAATAKKLASEGLNVAIFDMDEARGRAQAEKIGATFFKTDVSDPKAVAASMEAANSQLISVRILVNCAGIGGAAKTVSRGQAHDPALFDRIMRVNLMGSFNCASQFAAIAAGLEPINEDGARGVIVNTASVAAFDGQIGQLAYSASKGGITAMTLPMARDLADKGIRVCTIAPGLFLTPLLDELPEDVQMSLGQQVPFPSRLGRADEYAETVSHIIKNSMLNGEIIRLDGAIRMAPR